MGDLQPPCHTLQWALESMGILTGMMEIASLTIAGVVLTAAGLYQLTPFKYACPGHRQSPLTLSFTTGYPAGLVHSEWGSSMVTTALRLLVSDGSSVHWGNHEPYLDRRHRPLCGIEVCRWITVAAGVALTVAGLHMVNSSFLAA
jgi:predicted metal-binding membrane protein